MIYHLTTSSDRSTVSAEFDSERMTDSTLDLQQLAKDMVLALKTLREGEVPSTMKSHQFGAAISRRRVPLLEDAK